MVGAVASKLVDLEKVIGSFTDTVGNIIESEFTSALLWTSVVSAILSVAVALGNEYVYGAWRETVGTKKDASEEKQGEAEETSGAGKAAREEPPNAVVLAIAIETPVELGRFMY